MLTVLWWALNPDWKSSISWLCWGVLLLSLCLCFPSVPCLSFYVLSVQGGCGWPSSLSRPCWCLLCSPTCISSAHLPVLPLDQVDSPMCHQFLLPLVVVTLLCQLSFSLTEDHVCWLGSQIPTFLQIICIFPWLPHPALIVLFNPLEDFLPGQIHLVWFLLAVKTLWNCFQCLHFL